MNPFRTHNPQPSRPAPFQRGAALERQEQPADRVLMICFFLMMLFGLVAVYSALAFFAREKGTTATAMLFTHLPKLGLGVILMLAFSRVDYRVVVKASRYGLLASWVLLLLVNEMGEVVFGAKRSLSLAGFSFQPSSIAAAALLMHLAGLLAAKQDYIERFGQVFLPTMIWVVGTCGLIGLQDFSSAMLLFVLSLAMLVAGRVPAVQFTPILLAGLLGGYMLLGQSPERLSRIQEYSRQILTLPTESIETGEGYQAQQAQIAIARGGLFGVGIGKSTQREFLPAPYNDFLFAIIAEEYGAVGAFGVLGLLVMVLVRGVMVVARQAVDEIGMLAALGATLMICLQGMVHMGVSTGLLPVTGLPLPLMSYGGSHLLVMGAMAGVLLNVSRHPRSPRQPFYHG